MVEHDPSSAAVLDRLRLRACTGPDRQALEREVDLLISRFHLADTARLRRAAATLDAFVSDIDVGHARVRLWASLLRSRARERHRGIGE